NDIRSGGSSNGSIFGQVLRGIAIGTNLLARDTLGRLLIRSGGASLRSPTGNGAGSALYDTENLYDTQTSEHFLGSTTARYFPADWVTVEGTLGYDNRQRLEKYYEVKGYRTNGFDASQNFGQISFGNRGEESMNGSVTATLRKQLLSELNGKLTFRAL